MSPEAASREGGAPLVLFVPVSGAGGAGEYMRCLIVAESLVERHPDWRVRFVVSRRAAYAESVPFETTLVERSPTFHVREVVELVERERPAVAVFDCSGRTAQLRAARRHGCATVFVSQHRAKRRRGFRWKWMPLVSQHWITQLSFIAGGLTPLERLKLKAFGTRPPLFVGPVFRPPRPGALAGLRARHGLGDEPYLFLSPGGGGRHKGAEAAPRVVLEAAAELARGEGIRGLVVLGPNYRGAVPEAEGVVTVRSLENRDFIDLLAGSRLAVIGGGDVIGQALALGRAAVVVPVAKDQPARIRACARHGVVAPAALTAGSIAREARRLLREPGALEALEARVRGTGIVNGVGAALASLEELAAGAAGR